MMFLDARLGLTKKKHDPNIGIEEKEVKINTMIIKKKKKKKKNKKQTRLVWSGGLLFRVYTLGVIIRGS